ncbi:hypothetical protein [Acidaminobacter sp. JC074]|uniref:hypothetical protein n=1 Tax=Acidaminobacter sp. JC074 TaxID=2530199 RepID=UPI001F111C26|nr:hypothetical protein [Acidaminobacter sp. JC074]
MKNMMESMYVKVDVCKRCEDEKKVNKFGLCESCAAEVDYEYAVLYRIKEMEY